MEIIVIIILSFQMILRKEGKLSTFVKEDEIVRNLNWLATFFNIGRKTALFGRNRNLFGMRRRNNTRWSMWLSILGVAVSGLIYGLVRQNNMQDQNMFQPIRHMFDTNQDRGNDFNPSAMQSANVAFSEEIAPEKKNQ